MLKRFIASLLFLGLVIGVAEGNEDSTFSHSSASLDTSVTNVLAAQTKRNYLFLQNLHDTQKVWCMFNSATVQNNSGFQVTSSPIIFNGAVDRRAVYCRANASGTPLLIIQGVRN